MDFPVHLSFVLFMTKLFRGDLGSFMICNINFKIYKELYSPCISETFASQIRHYNTVLFFSPFLTFSLTPYPMSVHMKLLRASIQCAGMQAAQRTVPYCRVAWQRSMKFDFLYLRCILRRSTSWWSCALTFWLTPQLFFKKSCNE